MTFAEPEEPLPIVGSRGPAGRVAGAGECEETRIRAYDGFETVKIEHEARVGECERHLNRFGTNHTNRAGDVRPEWRDDQRRIARIERRLASEDDRDHPARRHDDVR